MIGHNSPDIAWPGEGFAGSNFTQGWDGDLQYHYGAIPVALELFGNQDKEGITARATLLRLKERGIRSLLVNMHHPYGGELPAPERFPDIFGGDLDAMMAEGLYPIVCPWGEEIEHPMYTFAQLAERWRATKAVLNARWPLWVIPQAFAQDRVRTPQCVAAWDSIYREEKVVNWNFYAVTRADLAPGAMFSPEWIAAQYPEAQIIISEWGMLHDPNRPDSPVWTDAEREGWIRDFGQRLVNNPQVALAFYFIPDGSPTWVQHHLNTDGKRNAMRILCDKSRSTRLWPRGTSAPAQPPAGNGDTDALIVQMHKMWATYNRHLDERDRHADQGGDIAQEMFNEVVAVKQILGVP